MCTGPFRVPSFNGSGSIVAFEPIVNMSHVHHLVLFGTTEVAYPELYSRPTATVQTQPAQGSQEGALCWGIPVIYSWARTGQHTPTGLRLPGSAGFGLGRDAINLIYLEIHYQNMSPEAQHDHSGARLSLSPVPPLQRLKVHWLHTENIAIPPQTPSHTVCTRCTVTGPGKVLAVRNHAHRLATALWSSVTRESVVVGEIGERVDPQAAQLFRLVETPGASLAQGLNLQRGDEILLHCEYNSSNVQTVVVFGADERKFEMCNQYLMAEESLHLDCDSSESLNNQQCVEAQGLQYKLNNSSWPLHAAKSQRCPPGQSGWECEIGQVSGVTVDPLSGHGDVSVHDRDQRRPGCQ